MAVVPAETEDALLGRVSVSTAGSTPTVEGLGCGSAGPVPEQNFSNDSSFSRMGLT